MGIDTSTTIWLACIGLIISPAYGWFWRPKPISFPCHQPLPSAPVYGSVSRSSHSSGMFVYQVVTYSCFPGYKLIGVSRRTCAIVWNHENPVCQLAVYDSAPGVCDFSYGSNCVYINSAANVYEWNKETTTTYITTDLPSFHNGRCIAGFYDGVHASADVPNPIVNKEPLPKFSLGSGIARRRRGTAQVELAHFKKSTDRQPNLDRVRRSCFRIAGKNVGVTPTKSTSTVLTANKVVSNEVFEVGKFVKHVSNSYIKFTFTASEGLGYYFYCYAHCLPDPLGILDQVGSVEESRSHETFRLFSTSSVGSHTVCLNLKDSVGCGEFAMRFSATILHLSSQAARLSFTPKGVYSSLAQAGCTSPAANET